VSRKFLRSAPFVIEFATGADQHLNPLVYPEALPLSHLYFCDGCSNVVSRLDLTEDIDSYYCPHCLENMPSSEAMLYGMRCSKCWACPVCSVNLTVVASSVAADEKVFHIVCSYCRWSSRGWMEAVQPEQLLGKIVALERESVSRQRMNALVENFRSRAQEQQRERELVQRLRRRSSLTRGAVSTSILTAKRFSSLMRVPRTSVVERTGTHGSSDDSSTGQWRIDDLETKLKCKLASQSDIRAEAYNAHSKSDHKGPDPMTRNLSMMQSAPSTAGIRKAGPGLPELVISKGLSVDEMISAHSQSAENGSLTDQILQVIDQDHDSNDVSSLMQRLLQVAYGYQPSINFFAKSNAVSSMSSATKESSDVVNSDAEAKSAVDTTSCPASELGNGHVQLEVPAQHTKTWSLLPMRQPLLTKRSRRCRLNIVGDEPGAETKVCGRIVVKPHINPCSNPPFQKNNVAVSFIPRCNPVLLKGVSGSDNEFELVFSMANPLESNVDLSFDTTAFNSSQKQNVNVTTPPFNTVIARYNDLADVHEAFSEESDRTKNLKENDDPDVVPDRKLNKILVRLRFQDPKPSNQSNPPETWVFFVPVALNFQDTAETKHTVKLVVQFASNPGLASKKPLFTPPSRRLGG